MKTLKQRHEDAPQKCGILSVPEAREDLRKVLRLLGEPAPRAAWAADYYRNNDEFLDNVFLDIPDDVKYH